MEFNSGFKGLMVNFHYISYIHFYFELRIVYDITCNPTVLNLSVVLKKISLGLLDYRPKSQFKNIHFLYTI